MSIMYQLLIYIQYIIKFYYSRTCANFSLFISFGSSAPPPLVRCWLHHWWQHFLASPQLNIAIGSKQSVNTSSTLFGDERQHENILQ
jgi:hypothetical protein